VEAGTVKEKIYGYRDDVLEELKREKRMEEPRKRRSGGMFDPGVDSVQISAKAQGDANRLKRLGVLLQAVKPHPPERLCLQVVFESLENGQTVS